MPVFSHSKLNEGKRERSKLLIAHLSGVHDKALSHFSSKVVFEKCDNVNQLLSVVCWLHDLGKYTSYFQTYLLEPEKVDQQLKAHSNLGAHTAFQYFSENPEKALLAFFLSIVSK
ncbi:CRISPR-associated endonuclease Cas3'' [Algoriphagus antarcticus]|uniref:CRISPR-associated endonuclease Cas3-HD n=1 Tax=Algoriphagus antarcticus TaxID=238540 RepID=A0A3E0D803_9BACT|nr:CRISPR-associated endonuclease Cas3'' [Algoriphagus antarcticus]REG78225.1 CRISPR-associated endonuclease Cas3-HD [Algoriphagus antarcticus]